MFEQMLVYVPTQLFDWVGIWWKTKSLGYILESHIEKRIGTTSLPKVSDYWF